jgi:hypothetical protein
MQSRIDGQSGKAKKIPPRLQAAGKLVADMESKPQALKRDSF